MFSWAFPPAANFIMSTNRPAVFETYFKLWELERQVGWTQRWWRDRIQAGELDLIVDDVLVAEPSFIAGEWLIPASCVNAFIARHGRSKLDPETYGIHARTMGELRRKLARQKTEALTTTNGS